MASSDVTYADSGDVEYVPVEEAGNYEPAEYEYPGEQYPEYEYEEPQLLENPLDTERKKSNRVALITVIVIVVIVIGLVFIFLYANLKKNKHTYDPFGGPVAIQNADGKYWNLGGVNAYFGSELMTVDEKKGAENLLIYGPDFLGLQLAGVVFVDGRRRDPATRWLIKKEMTGIQIVSAFAPGSRPLEVNTREMGTTWPPTFTINNTYPTPLPANDYGAFVSTLNVWTYLFNPSAVDVLMNFEFISAGARTSLGYPYRIKVLETDPLGPDYYLAEIDPPNWPKGIDDPGTDQIDEGKVDFMNERKILFVSTTPQTWYIL